MRHAPSAQTPHTAQAADRACSRALRRACRKPPACRGAASAVRAGTETTNAPASANGVMSFLRIQEIRRAIQSLPESRQLVFVMSHFEGMKYAEIAEVLNVPVGTVKSRMFAAVRSLQALLKEEIV